MNTMQRKKFLFSLDKAVFEVEKYAKIWGYDKDEELKKYLQQLKDMKPKIAHEMTYGQIDND